MQEFVTTISLLFLSSPSLQRRPDDLIFFSFARLRPVVAQRSSPPGGGGAPGHRRRFVGHNGGHPTPTGEHGIPKQDGVIP